jgi:Transposase
VSVLNPRRSDRSLTAEGIMEAIVERCCGLDIHQASVVACLLAGTPGRKPRKQTRTFGTMTRDLEALRDWLVAAGATHVGMESTGVYWKPVHAVLEGRFELIVGNAQHIKAVPGRKTDVKDAEWIAELVRHGLIRPSFVPPPAIRELRELLRYRRALAGALASERNRAIKLLETAGIKLASVATDVFGASGTAMLRALAEGRATPAEMAGLAKGRLRRKLYGLHASQLFTWQRQLATPAVREVPAFVPVVVAAEDNLAPAEMPCRIEIALGPAVVRVGADVDAAALRRVLEVVRGLA